MGGEENGGRQELEYLQKRQIGKKNAKQTIQDESSTVVL